MRFFKMKPIHAKWLVKATDHLGKVAGDSFLVEEM